MKPLTVTPIVGRRVLFPPGWVSISLTHEHRQAYLLLYGLSFPLADVPPLKDHDFDGLPVKMRRRQLAALNREFRSLQSAAPSGSVGPFQAQEGGLTKHFKEMQFLS